MRRPRLDKLQPMPDLPKGYSIRQAVRKDEESLATLLTGAFPEEPWDCNRVVQKLLDTPEVRVTFVMEHRGELVATASERYLPDRFPGSGYLHWVGVNPKHQGMGLGKVISLRALHAMYKNGYMDAVLETDDHRLPAIRTYLNLGFLPEDVNPSDLDRWGAIFDKLERYQARKS